MKSFQQYLTESRESYKYRVRVANCDMTPDLVDRIEMGLKKFDLVSMSKPKSQPPEDRSYEFPDVGICGVHEFKVETNYPTNDAGLRTAVSRAAGVPEDHVTAYTEEGYADRIEKTQQVKKPKADKKQSILANDKMESQPRPRDSMEMLKDLESRKYEFAAKNTEKTKSTNELSQGNMSPVGSRQNKLPSARGAKK